MIPLINFSPHEVLTTVEVPLERIVGGNGLSDTYAVLDLFNQVWLTPEGKWEIEAEMLHALPVVLPAYGVRVLRLYPIFRK